MKQEQILEKAIEKAEKNGWKEDVRKHYCICGEPSPDSIIFSHSFAKAFWGEKLYNPYDFKEGDIDYCIYGNYGECCLHSELKPIFEYHLQQMVLEKEPLKYLERFL